ncbi:hypothetical protein C7C46_02985 [Streptomyces tateyamensis]|uniref:Septum formation-related domain-containing protein n=1 Tax=Streptomyces tateyamensis TaxID=565073 RepID=A0A2V4PN89_9ACTN|nr:hypothetical protein [Streptomyces tateyamensis]PYC87730.1 hypothetical protein C7C46_02985 [Streptomyces tateyamensis]
MTKSPRSRTAATVVALLVALAGVAAVLLWPSSPKHPAAAAPPSPSHSPSPSPSPSPTKKLPYPWFPVGSCVDHPKLSPVITAAEARPCQGPHDGESIANPLLPDGLTKESQIALALIRACQPYVTSWEAAQGGGTWYGIPMGPSLAYYNQGLRDATCLLTDSQHEGGTKLTGPLKPAADPSPSPAASPSSG